MTEQPQPEPPPGVRPLWELNRDEQRTMFITVVGGLGSIILGAVFLGVVIALARFLKTHPFNEFLGFVAIGAFAIAFVDGLIERRRGRRVTLRRLGQVFVALIVLVWIVYLLALIGQAAGVK
jgi:hypothetical protein